MCIAIYKPHGKDISKDILRRCWVNNSDGAGFMYSENNKLIIKKGFFNFKRFWKSYQVSSLVGKDVVIHFRIATHGIIDKENCHPHLVNENLAFVHNGIIETSKNIVLSDQSDTILFNESILQRLDKKFNGSDWINCKVIVELIAGYIEDSKLIFMDHRGTVKIINENLGCWDAGIWYSNSGYLVKFSHSISSYGSVYPDNRYDYMSEIRERPSTAKAFNNTEGNFKKYLKEKFLDDKDDIPLCAYCGASLTSSKDDTDNQLCADCAKRFGVADLKEED